MCSYYEWLIQAGRLWRKESMGAGAVYLHATILHLMGFDHERLTYRHSGRDFRLTDVAGNVVKGLLA